MTGISPEHVERKCTRWQLPDSIRGARLAAHAGKSHSDGSTFSNGGENLCLTVVGNVVGNFEITECTCDQTESKKEITIQ